MGHAERAHALLSASSAHRWLYCTPSAKLEEQFPDTTSEAAKEGTLAHELAEMKVRNYFYTTDFGKRKLTAGINKLKKEELWQDEMVGYTDEYLDYIKSVALAMKIEPYVAIEKRVDFSAYVPEGFGTADCVLIGGKVLHVIDFKYGKSPDGRVKAEGNPQLALYALGAYETYKVLYPIEEIKMSIVQPRLPDGISEWGCPLSELLAWGKYVQERAELATKGEGDFSPGPKTCKYCRARGRCRARAEENVRLAFSPDKGKLPPLITNEQMGQYLTQGADVAKWLSDLQDCALAECLAGKEVPGWKAVEGRGSRVWTDMDEAFSKLKENGISETVLWERKPLTLAQIEKVVGKKDFETFVGDKIEKAPGKPALVKESDKRPAITNTISAKDAFKEDI
ncbi:DUF2800 domain-containing protein [Lacrimispora sp. JR3]|uniref:DUF2800 domain-containing protein n=1 Tax=Lacrimispora sinapis TaxID=3111456 RepID=UPI0037486971